MVSGHIRLYSAYAIMTKCYKTIILKIHVPFSFANGCKSLQWIKTIWPEQSRCDSINSPIPKLDWCQYCPFIMDHRTHLGRATSKSRKWHVRSANTQIILGFRSVFAVDMKVAETISYLSNVQLRLWSDWADAIVVSWLNFFTLVHVWPLT